MLLLPHDDDDDDDDDDDGDCSLNFNGLRCRAQRSMFGLWSNRISKRQLGNNEDPRYSKRSAGKNRIGVDLGDICNFLRMFYTEGPPLGNKAVRICLFSPAKGLRLEFLASRKLFLLPPKGRTYVQPRSYICTT